VAEVKEKPKTSAQSLANHLIKTYGREAFNELIEMLRSGASGAKISFIFQVSRQCVHQWKHTLGRVVSTYELDPEIEHLAPRVELRTVRRTVI